MLWVDYRRFRIATEVFLFTSVFTSAYPFWATGQTITCKTCVFLRYRIKGRIYYTSTTPNLYVFPPFFSAHENPGWKPWRTSQSPGNLILLFVNFEHNLDTAVYNNCSNSPNFQFSRMTWMNTVEYICWTKIGIITPDEFAPKDSSSSSTPCTLRCGFRSKRPATGWILD